MPESLTDREKETLRKVLSAPIFFPEPFKDWLTDFIGTNIPLIPFSHFFGAKSNLARSGNSVSASETTTSATYADLTTLGPEITGLANGTYAVFFGTNMAGQGAYAAVSVNAAVPSDDDAVHESEIDVTAGRGLFVTLTSNNVNKLTMKYRKEGGASATFKDRWMSALRIGAG